MSFTPVNGDKKPEVAEEPTSLPSIAPVTPKKGSPSKRRAASEEGSSKKPKGTPNGQIPRTKIASSYEDLPPQDKMLLKMKEDGKSWKEIQDAWETLTGKRFAGLAARYTRLKASLARVKEEDMESLKTAVAAANEQIKEEQKAIEKKRWTIVATHMVENAGTKYDLATLEKAWKAVTIASPTEHDED